MQIPIYQQIMSALITRIESGEYLPNEKIPSERELAELYEVNRMTVKKAIERLEERGYVYRISGKGTFVKGEKNKLLLGMAGSSRNVGMMARTSAMGMTAGNKVIFADIIEGYDSMCLRLRLKKTESIFALHRIRLGDNEPLAIEYTYVPAACFDDILEQDFTNVSLYDYMNTKGQMPVEFTQRLMIIKCPKRESKLLKLDENNNAVFYFEYTGRNSRGQVVEFTRSFLKSEKTLFKFFQYRPDSV